MLAAQVLWYFMEGYAARTGEYPASKIRSYGRFSVLMNDGEQELIFYKSPVSGRWWMEVPVQARPDGRSAMEVLVPCTQEDYDKACADEIPDRWWGRTARDCEQRITRILTLGFQESVVQNPFKKPFYLSLAASTKRRKRIEKPYEETFRIVIFVFVCRDECAAGSAIHSVRAE